MVGASCQFMAINFHMVGYFLQVSEKQIVHEM